MVKNLIIKIKLALATLFVITLFFPPLSISVQPAQAQIDQNKFEQTATVSAKQLDNRAVILRDYLTLKDSPLSNYAQDFIEAADLYRVDWRLVPSIAGVESTFGKVNPGGFLYPSYNAWGWGVYGNQATYFKSWKNGIYELNKGLREKYLDQGLITPYAMNRVYATSPVWGSKVDFFMSELAEYARQYQLAAGNPNYHVIVIKAKGETASAQLAARL